MREKRAALHELPEAQASTRERRAQRHRSDAPFEVHSIRPSMRTDWKGKPRFQWVIELTQRIPQYLDRRRARRGRGARLLLPRRLHAGGRRRDRQGALQHQEALDERRKERQRRYLLDEGNESLAATYFGGVAERRDEPFAMLHRF